MKCSACGNEMVELFASSACDWCDGKVSQQATHVGYVVWRGFLGPGFPHYVFEDQRSAELWKSRQHNNPGEVRKVISTAPISYRDGRGVQSGVRFADHLYEVFPDAKFRQAPHRAWLAPEQP
jgi:hypothetical protein